MEASIKSMALWIIINNGCYTFIYQLKQALPQEVEMLTCRNLDSTIHIIVMFVLPYMNPDLMGIISIPVKPNIEQKGEAGLHHLSNTIEDFSNSLHVALGGST